MKVYIILKNADFTEGRGPMLFYKAFVNKSAMVEYVNSITGGIFGAKPEEGQSFYEYATSGKDGGWAGYEIKEVEAE